MPRSSLCRRLCEVGRDPPALRILAGGDRDPRRRADRRVDVELLEADALGGQAVDVRRLRVLVAEAREVRPAHVVDEDQDDVRPRRPRPRPARSRRAGGRSYRQGSFALHCSLPRPRSGRCRPARGPSLGIGREVLPPALRSKPGRMPRQPGPRCRRITGCGAGDQDSRPTMSSPVSRRPHTSRRPPATEGPFHLARVRNSERTERSKPGSSSSSPRHLGVGGARCHLHSVWGLVALP